MGEGQKVAVPLTRINSTRPTIIVSAMANAPPVSQSIGSPRASSEVCDRVRVRCGLVVLYWASELIGPPAKPQADDFGDGVNQKREHKQAQRREEQGAIVSTVDRRLGQLHGDVCRQGAEAVEDVPLSHRRVAGGHE